MIQLHIKEVHTLAFAETSESAVLKHITPLEIIHQQDVLHYTVHTQQADPEHNTRPYVTRRPGSLKSLPVTAALVLELCEVMVHSTLHS
jgi:hypothetical protein